MNRRYFYLYCILVVVSHIEIARSEFRNDGDCLRYGSEIEQNHGDEGTRDAFERLFIPNDNDNTLITLTDYVVEQLASLDRGSIISIIEPLKTMVTCSFALQRMSECCEQLGDTTHKSAFVDAVVKLCESIGRFNRGSARISFFDQDVIVNGFNIAIYNLYLSRTGYCKRALCRCFPCCDYCCECRECSGCDCCCEYCCSVSEEIGGRYWTQARRREECTYNLEYCWNTITPLCCGACCCLGASTVATLGFMGGISASETGVALGGLATIVTGYGLCLKRCSCCELQDREEYYISTLNKLLISLEHGARSSSDQAPTERSYQGGSYYS